MQAHAAGGTVRLVPPERPRTPTDVVSDHLAQLWPLLMAASEASESPDPCSAGPHLARAAAVLLDAASRVCPNR